MQGQRGTFGSLSETLDCDNGSTSSNAAIDQQLFWNNLSNSAEDRTPDFMLPPNDTHIIHLNSVAHEGHNLGRWSLGEPSSSNSRSEFGCDEPKRDHVWSPSLVASRLEEQFEPTHFHSVDSVNLNFCSNRIQNGPLLLQSPRSDSITKNNDSNGRLLAHNGDDCQLIEFPNSYESGKSLNEQLQSASSSSDPFGSHSRNGRDLVEENDDRPDCSLQGRHISCKRKAFEGVVGQSFVDGRSTFQHTESSAWHAMAAQNYAGSSLSISSPLDNILGIGSSDQVNVSPGIAAGVSPNSLPSVSVPGNAESFRRNVRMRVNPSRHQDSVPPNLCSRGSDNGHLDISSPSTVNHSPDLGSAQSGDSRSSQSQSSVVRVPPVPRNGNAFRLYAASSSGPGNSSSPVISGVRDAILHEESNSRSLPMFIPTTELRNSAQNPTNWNLTGGNIGIPENVASISRPGSRSVNLSSSASNLVHNRNPSSQNSRRLTELVHRSLIQSSIGSESVGQSSNHPPSHYGPSASSQAMAPSSIDGNEGPHPFYTRSAFLLNRQGDGFPEFPYSLRNPSTSREGRNRLVSEIRNVLDVVCRGEGLRFEDQVMIFDHPAFFGAPDAHDRHRDMRLDVDTMSYEELLALEERIGNVNTGLSEETILNHLKQHKYSCDMLGAAVNMEPCCVCQEDYIEEDDLGTLDCGHEFHTGCIKQWLTHKNLCPICKTTALKKHG